MKISIILAVLLATQVAKANSSDGNRWSVGGFYGIGFTNPKDLNDSAGNQITTPKLNNLSSENIYGASLGFLLIPTLQFKLVYEMQSNKNPVTTSSPFVASGVGYEMTQNEVWAELNYFLIRSARAFAYVGASMGYPIVSRVTTNLAIKTDYDADKTLGLMGQLGVGLMLSQHFSVFIEGGYQSVVSGDIKSSTGAVLTTSNGSKAKLDLSAPKASAGIAIDF